MQDYREFLDEIIISEEALQQRIKALGAEISQDFAGKKLHLICILRGGVLFLADLIRQITVPDTIDFMAVTSYGVGRVYGTFPRVIWRFVRELRALTLEEAIRKMTLASATRLGLHDRGSIRVGLTGDAVLFDPATFCDTATFAEPCQHPIGLKAVAMDGRLRPGGRTNDRRTFRPIPSAGERGNVASKIRCAPIRVV